MAGGLPLTCRHRSPGILTTSVVCGQGVYPGRVHPRTYPRLRLGQVLGHDLGLGSASASVILTLLGRRPSHKS